MNTIPTQIESETAAVRVDYGPLAPVLLDGARAFFQLQGIEDEFQAWKAARDAHPEGGAA